MRVLLAAMLVMVWQVPAVACSVERRAVVAMDFAGGLPLVELAVNGRAATFVLDSGAQRSAVTPAAVARLGLAQDEWVATSTSGIGGTERHRNALPQSLALGGVALVRRTVARDTSLTVVSLPRDAVGGRRVDGVLGRDYLASFDLALDGRAHTLGLYAVDGCRAEFVPWAGTIALPTENPADTALVVRLEIDGVAVRALLDTGASRSTLTAVGMARFSLTPESLAQDATRAASGIGPQQVKAWSHRFGRMRIGEETMAQPLLAVAQIRPVPVVDMLLGADWLASRRVWISYATRQVFVARP
jgi:predicted aspartyl protease